MSLKTPPPQKTISIDADLYEYIRDYCDKNYLRLADFIEDALENATYRDKEAERAKEISDMRKEIRTECEKAFVWGFRNGVIATILDFQGKTGLSNVFKDRMDTGIKSHMGSVPGQQLDLFGDPGEF